MGHVASALRCSGAPVRGAIARRAHSHAVGQSVNRRSRVVPSQRRRHVTHVRLLQPELRAASTSVGAANRFGAGARIAAIRISARGTPLSTRPDSTTLTGSVTAGADVLRAGPPWLGMGSRALHEITKRQRPPIAVSRRTAPRRRAGRRGGALDSVAGQPADRGSGERADGIQKRATGNSPQARPRSEASTGAGKTIREARRRCDADGGGDDRTFDAPGTYVLRVLAWDDSGPQGPIMAGGFQCCWTNAYVDIDVR